MIAFETTGLQFKKDKRQGGVAVTGRKGCEKFTDAGQLVIGILSKREAFGDESSGYGNGIVVPLFHLLLAVLPVEVDTGDAPANPCQQAHPGGRLGRLFAANVDQMRYGRKCQFICAPLVTHRLQFDEAITGVFARRDCVVEASKRFWSPAVVIKVAPEFVIKWEHLTLQLTAKLTCHCGR